MNPPAARCLLALAAAVAGWTPARAADTAADVRRHLDGLRGIAVPQGKAKIDELTDRMDATWKFVHDHRAEARPILRAELQMAIEAPRADQFFLLDIGYLLVTEEGDNAAEFAVAALARIDPAAEIIRANWRELFDFAVSLGATGRAADRYLAQMDRIYLNNQRDLEYFQAPHLVKLTPGDMACIVYGVAGAPAAAHLAALATRDTANRAVALQVLSSIGSEVEVPAIAAILSEARDNPTVTAAIRFMMMVGGPSGRAAVLGTDAKRLDARASAYAREIRSKVEEITLPVMLKLLEQVGPAKAISDRELQAALDAMEAKDGKDDETTPATLLKSGIPTGKLLAQMKRIRARSFRQKNNHVFDDLPISNLLINALQYKLAAPVAR